MGDAVWCGIAEDCCGGLAGLKDERRGNFFDAAVKRNEWSLGQERELN